MTFQENIHAIFSNGSKTYSNSSSFFPAHIREDVTRLYAFVRIADDFVDSVPQQAEEFLHFRQLFLQARSAIYEYSDLDDVLQRHSDLYEQICYSHALLERHYLFEPAWTNAFLDSMEADIHKPQYNTLQDTERYIYGSANVIGLFMARMLNLPNVSYYSAEHLGKAMQYINFIRDIQEDLDLGRSYFPNEDLAEFGLSSLKYEDTIEKPEAYKAFIMKQLMRFYTWQHQAEEGFKYIPRRLRVPIQTASDMYKWTAKQIANDPFLVYKRQVKPSKRMVATRGVINTITPYRMFKKLGFTKTPDQQFSLL